MLPGYKHVREFGPDEKYEDEEEEEVCYVTLDLGSDIDKALLPNSTECRLAGLDTETPMLQLAGSFFLGRHQELIGTELLFTDGRDENNPSRRFVVPFGMTEQRIEFKQVDVKPKIVPINEDVTATASSSSKPKRSSKKGKGKAKSSKAKGKEPERAEPERDEVERDGLEEEEQGMDIEPSADRWEEGFAHWRVEIDSELDLRWMVEQGEHPPDYCEGREKIDGIWIMIEPRVALVVHISDHTARDKARS